MNRQVVSRSFMIRHRVLVFLLPFLALLAACRQVPPPPTALPVAVESASPPPERIREATPLPSTSEPAVPVPRVSIQANTGPIPIPTPVEHSEEDLSPVTSATAEIPPPVEPFLLPEGVEVLALLGMDEESGGEGRTDTILLVFYNLQNGTASLVSVPRDLYVYLPGVEMNRINTAFYKGGFDLLALTFEYNLGVRPRHWAAANFADFIRFIDDLGGINVQVSDPMPDDCGGIPPGKVHMDGTMTLCYLRERRTTSDIDRSRRQQEVLQVILDRVIALESLRHLPEWYERYRESVMTDLTLPDLIAFIPLVLKLPDSGLEKYQISWDEVETWKVPDTGAEVFLPQRERITALLHRAVAGLSSSVEDSRAFEKRIAALTATATLPPPPEEPVSTDPAAQEEMPTPTPMPAPTELPSDGETPTLAPSNPPP